jgi:DNA-binding LacI/PurR family transcriptional regulator
MIKRTEIKKNVPHGYAKKIADRAGVSTRYVSRFMNNSNINSERVEMAALEIIAEIRQRKQILIEQINRPEAIQ